MSLSLFSLPELCMQGLGLWASVRILVCAVQQRATRAMLLALVCVVVACLGGLIVAQRLRIIDGQHTGMLALQQAGIDNQIKLLQAQQEILQMQGQVISLQGQVIAVQGRLVDAIETELYLMSLPQMERPRLPMPSSLRDRLSPGGAY